MLAGVRALAALPPTVTPTSAAGKRSSEVCSPFVAAAVCEALSLAGERGADVRAQLGEVTRYLRDTQEPDDGSWCFDPHERRWPPDCDSTSCAAAALALTGEAAGRRIVERVLHTQSGSDGLLRTWLLWYAEADERLDGNAVDAIVSANVVFAATRLGCDASPLLEALEDHVDRNGVGGIATAYYDSPAMRAYYLARAVASVADNGPTAKAVRHVIRGVDPGSLNAVEVAAALAAAARLGVEPAVERLLPALLACEADGGGWPEARWFTDPVGNAWRSVAFSTALAVEALALSEPGDVA